MLRFVVVALLLAILANNFYSSTASQKKLYVSEVHVRKCGCRVFASGKIRCPFRLFHSKYPEIQDLVVKCFCNKKNRHKFPELQAACTSNRPFLTPPL